MIDIKRMSLLAWSIIMLLLIQTIGSSQPFPHAAHAASIWYVSPLGNDSNACTLALPCRSVQKAVNGAVSGDTVRLAEGNYADSQSGVNTTYSSSALIGVVNKALTIEGGWDTGFTSRSVARYATTILDGDNTKRVLYISNSGSTVILDGFYVTKGYGNGAGVNVLGSPITMNNLLIAYNQELTSGSCGGGIAFSGTIQATVSNTTIDNNVAGGLGGGGICIIGDGQLTLQNTTVSNNHTTGVTGGGMKIMAGSGGTFTLNGGLFTRFC